MQAASQEPPTEIARSASEIGLSTSQEYHSRSGVLPREKGTSAPCPGGAGRAVIRGCRKKVPCCCCCFWCCGRWPLLFCVCTTAAFTYCIIALLVFSAANLLAYPGSLQDAPQERQSVAGCEEFEFASRRPGRVVKGLRCLHGSQQQTSSTRRIISFGGNLMYMWDAATTGSQLVSSTVGGTVEVFSFSYPGYSPNDGWPTEDSIVDDAIGLARFVLEAPGADQPPIVFGFSLGAAVAVAVTSEAIAPACLVLLNPFSSLRGMLKAYEGGELLMPWAWAIDDWPSEERAGRMQSPAMVLSSTDDEVIPAWMHRKVFDRFPSKEKVLIELSATHTEIGKFFVAHASDIANFFNSSCPLG